MNTNSSTKIQKTSSPASRAKDVIAAALIHLASSMEDGEVEPGDGDIGAIMTCDGEHQGMSSEQIRDLALSVLESGVDGALKGIR